ncbi:MAG: GtrA family protein [Oligoflexia bacterium]
MTQNNFLKSFSRAQVASIAATVVDLGLLVALVEWAGLWYVVATSLGATAGAVTNFWINRSWSFGSTRSRWEGQALRYALVSGGSLVLNTAGVFGLTEFVGTPYAGSKIVAALVIGWFFNYPLHRSFVFSQASTQG